MDDSELLNLKWLQCQSMREGRFSSKAAVTIQNDKRVKCENILANFKYEKKKKHLKRIFIMQNNACYVTIAWYKEQCKVALISSLNTKHSEYCVGAVSATRCSLIFSDGL